MMTRGIEIIHTTVATRTILDIDADEEGQYITLKLRNTNDGHKHITMKPEFARALYVQLEEFVEGNFPETMDVQLDAIAGGHNE